MSFDIRLARPDDAAALLAIYAPIVATTAISFELEPPTLAEMQQRVATTLRRYPWLVAVAHDEIAGYVYASAYRERAAYQWSVDVTAYIHPEQRRRGLGHALYQALFAQLRQQGFVNAYAVITLPNAASVGLHEALGFARVAVYERVGYKLGAWHTVGCWHLLLQEPPAAPDPPSTPAASG